MASFTFFDNFTTAQTLATGEFGFIADTGSLVVDDDAITADGDVAVLVFGLLSAAFNAVDHEEGAFVLTVGASGRVAAEDGDAILSDDATDAFVNNRGRIVSAFDAVDIESNGSISVVNHGFLIGESDGLVTDGGTGLTRIVNNGTIDGFEGGIDHLGGESLLINRGRIAEGESYGFSGAADIDEVRNSGTIRGGVLTEGEDDFVLNRGVIDFVNLGLGDDVYIGVAEGQAQRVDGRDGEDVLVSSRADDRFKGGTGGDLFSFDRRGGEDRIDDFGGIDVIDLSDFGFSGFSELRPLIEDRPNGALIDLSDDGLTIFLAGVDKADLRANDFIFELTVM